MTATGHDFDVLWALPKVKQSAYGTKNADVDLTFAYPFHGPDVVAVEHGFKDDLDEYGKGHEFATRQDEEFTDVKLARNWHLNSWIAGWLGAFGLGTCSSEVQGITSAYKHTSKMSDPDTVENQDPSFSIVEDRDGIKRLVRDLVVADFTVSGNLKERLKFAVNLVGSGHTEASALAMPSLTVGSFLRMGGAKLEIGPAASEVDVSQRLKSFEISVNKNLRVDEGYKSGCGLVRSECKYGVRSVAFKFVLERQGTQEKDWIEANTLLKAILTVEGATIEDPYKHSLIVTFTNLKLRAIPVSYDAGFEIYSAEILPLYTAADVGPILWEVINTETSYLS